MSKRPKIGVALAGGAALGLSHVGVLQWLEEHRIPVDYIAGTSMGGLIAAIHASGLSSAETTELVRSIDWRLALSSNTPYHDLAFRRKEDAAHFPVAVELGLKGGKLRLPSGLSPGQGVALVIDRFAAPYGDMKSFNDLPTPFRCVASDLSTGKGVVMESGSLFDALRATMSLPALFEPVRKGDMVLVDGGLTNNLPVDLVRSMGADVVIAVALDIPANPADFQSLLGIAGRSVSYMIAANERSSIANADLVLIPQLKGMVGTDYLKWEEFRKIGYTAAEQKAKMLARFEVSPDEYEAYRKVRESKRLSTNVHPVRVEIEGDVAPKRKAALVQAIMPEPGVATNPVVLEDEIRKLTGAGRYQVATYEYRSTSEGEALVLKVQEKHHGPPLLKPGIFLEGANGDGLRFGIGARLTFLDVGGPASEWRTDLSIGTFNLLSTEYYYRIRGGKWFVAPIGTFSQNPFPLYDREGTRTEEFNERNLAGGADLGYAFGRLRELRAGYHVGHLRQHRNAAGGGIEEVSGRYGRTSLLFRRDGRNNPLVPTSGSFVSLRASWFDKYPLVEKQFPAFEGHLTHSVPLNSRYSLWMRASGAGTASDIDLSTMYRLGGVFSMSAFARQQLIGNKMYLGHAYVLRSFSEPSLSAFGSFHALLGYEIGQAWFPGQSATPRQDGVLGIISATPVGVVFFGGAVGDRGEKKILFRLGRTF